VTEVIGGSDFERVEIQSIMLREVQEWAAAGPLKQTRGSQSGARLEK